MSRTILTAFTLLILTQICFSQNANVYSKNQIEKQRSIYKINKVKTEIIYSDKNSKEVTSYDKEGKPIESVYFYDNNISGGVLYTYDMNGNLIEDVYGGAESGDVMTNRYYYDESGNVIASEYLMGLEESGYKINYKYDDFGNLILKGDIGIQNIYEKGNLISSVEECIPNSTRPEFKKFTYDIINNLILYEVFNKNCTGDSTFFLSKNRYEYFENGLKSKETFESSYTEGMEVLNYEYQYFKK